MKSTIEVRIDCGAQSLARQLEVLFDVCAVDTCTFVVRGTVLQPPPTPCAAVETHLHVFAKVTCGSADEGEAMVERACRSLRNDHGDALVEQPAVSRTEAEGPLGHISWSERDIYLRNRVDEEELSASVEELARVVEAIHTTIDLTQKTHYYVSGERAVSSMDEAMRAIRSLLEREGVNGVVVESLPPPDAKGGQAFEPIETEWTVANLGPGLTGVQGIRAGLADCDVYFQLSPERLHCSIHSTVHTNLVKAFTRLAP